MVLRDFWCRWCEVMFEALQGKDDVITHECGSVAESRLSAPRIGMYNDPEKRSEVLKKRSREHTEREQKKGNLPTSKDYGI